MAKNPVLSPSRATVPFCSQSRLAIRFSFQWHSSSSCWSSGWTPPSRQSKVWLLEMPSGWNPLRGCDTRMRWIGKMQRFGKLLTTDNDGKVFPEITWVTTYLRWKLVHSISLQKGAKNIWFLWFLPYDLFYAFDFASKAQTGQLRLGSTTTSTPWMDASLSWWWSYNLNRQDETNQSNLFSSDFFFFTQLGQLTLSCLQKIVFFLVSECLSA